jgi:hypothetical protein
MTNRGTNVADGIPQLSPRRTNKREDEEFYPTGAIVFFIALILLCLAIWFGIYFLMLERV